MTEPTPAPHAHLDSKWRTVALVILPILGILLVIIAIYLVRPRDPGVVTVVYSDGQTGAADINTGDILDATDPRAGLEPRLGYRYKLFVEDESDDRTSGVAKIGGRVTFIPGARRGQTVIADVTRVRERVVDANLIRVLSEIDLPPKAAPAPFEPAPGDSAGHVIAGAEMDVIISEASSKNPDTEGIARVAGLVVVVNGVPTVGERVNIRITDRRERIAFAEPTGKPAGTGPLPDASSPSASRRSHRSRGFTPAPGDRAAHVLPGAEMDVTISEESGQNPGVDGVARVEGLVVFVEGVPSIGETVHVRITDRRERAANAVPTGKPAGSGSSSPSAAAPAADDPAGHVLPGAELDLTIEELSRKNPATEGVAKVEGLVVFVQGGTSVGETVRARITGRRDRVAFAEVIAPSAP